MLLEKLRAKAKETYAAMQAVLKASESTEGLMTAEQKTEYEGLKASYKEVVDAIELHEEAEKMTAEHEASAPVVGSRGFAGAPAPHAKKEFESSQEFLTACLGGKDQRLNEVTFSAEQSVSAGAKGGFMVPKEFRNEFLQVDAEEAVIGSAARLVPPGNNPDAEVSFAALDQSGSTDNMYSGVALSWFDLERDADMPSTDAKLREITLKPQGLGATVDLTNKLLANWSSGSGFMQQLLKEALAHAKEIGYLRGRGVGQPLGVLYSAALKKVNRATTLTVTYADLVGMEAEFLEGPGAFWLANPKVLPKLRLLVDGANHLIFSGPKDGLPATLMGRPLKFYRRMPQLGALGDIGLFDFKKYLVKQGSGPYIATSEHVLFKRYRTVLRIIDGVDGQPWLTAPIVGENGVSTETYSPFVALDVPA